MTTLMKDRIRNYIDNAERLETIVATVDMANGDMIILYRTEEASGGRSLRMSPEMGARFRYCFSLLVQQKSN
jgi:hypothetical protein